MPSPERERYENPDDPRFRRVTNNSEGRESIPPLRTIAYTDARVAGDDFKADVIFTMAAG